ncbi:outer membrane beta-barrel protein [Fodinibius sediminis]|uniref:Outer membrane autotransporter barrel domain-containing protein n=1 Tax=Fodinibius sediminis TaxID=1214077 RepID=A0A521C4U1_9BACT|nr:outer membrane beta-barrel protein [Fodinibius sediminis]SMO54418.1 outer membrane autotransporter barrel domain-containing protein [Fodinibius sediminis]
MRFTKLLSLTFSFTFLLSMAAFAQQNQGATIGGYGELHYNDVTYNANGDQTPGEFDFHRFILYAGYNFNEWITFRSELEVEHTYVKDGHGEVALEQAYIDMRYQPALGVRAGIMLVPMGIVNPVHEPPTFNGVERPNVEKYIIPSTWREAGAGIYGKSRSGLSYELYLMAGLDASGITGNEGIRDARQKAFEASTDNWAVAGRLDYRANLNLTVGTSYFFSDLSTDATYGDAMDGVNMHMIDGHAIYTNRGFEARGLFVYSQTANVEDLNATFGNAAGESQYGGYLELAYDLLRLSDAETEQQLNLFGRGEVYDTQASTVTIPDNPENERYEYTFGLTYKPAPQVAFKADYQLLKSEGIKDIQQFNLGVGYNF